MLTDYLTTTSYGDLLFTSGPRSAIGSASDSRATCRCPGFDTRSTSADSKRADVSYWRKYADLVLVDGLGVLSLPGNTVIR